MSGPCENDEPFRLVSGAAMPRPAPREGMGLGTLVKFGDDFCGKLSGELFKAVGFEVHISVRLK